MRALITLRGKFDYPPLAIVDLINFKLIDIIYLDVKVKCPNKFKGGSNGLGIVGDKVIVALWDSIVVLDKKTFNIINQHRSHYFTDLHGLHIENNNDIFVANTNLDAIYKINNYNQSELFWHASKKPNLSENYNNLTKDRSPFHRFHINDVIITDKYILLSFLGVQDAGYRTVMCNATNDSKKQSTITRIGKKIGILKTYKREGGVIFDNKHSLKRKKIIYNEGLHDLVLYNNYIISTEYFGNCVIFFNKENLIIEKRINLVSPDLNNYLSRGVLIIDDKILIGHTVVRGSEKTNPCALIREYDHNGNYTGNEIKINGSTGIYSMAILNNN